MHEGVLSVAVRLKTLSNLYRDSVSLMRFSAGLAEIPGIEQASAVMATEANLALLVEAGLIDKAIKAEPNGLLIVLVGEDEAVLDAAMTEATAALTRTPLSRETADVAHEGRPRSIAMAVGGADDPTLALISTPGDYAASEALKALRLGLNVMIFSDNVSIEDEILLKQAAADSGLLVMGPDCGTAIINGVPLGFANEVRRGDIGIVAASGTGLQQVCSLVDRYGKGISQAIGTGGRDLQAEVGGMTMSRGLALLAEDPETSVIVLVSKPPAAEVASRVVGEATAIAKPVIINFLGMSAFPIDNDGVVAAATLEQAARSAAAILSGESPPSDSGKIDAKLLRDLESAIGRLAAGQRYVRGLYSGGTFCYETVSLLHHTIGGVRSNTPIEPGYGLDDPWSSDGHTVTDLGADIFTRGRPHPMIDHGLRNERLLREAEDPETAVILFDLVLGHGAHPDPAKAMLPAIETARRTAAAAGRGLVLIGSVCGTERDPQRLSRQEKQLGSAGVILAESNAASARLAAAVMERIE